jgi:hypothetical protein
MFDPVAIISPTKPDMDIVAQVAAMRPADLADMLRWGWYGSKRLGWMTGLLLERMGREAVHPEASSIAEWAAKNLDGLDRSSVSRLQYVARELLKRNAEERTKWLAVSAWRAYDAFKIAERAGDAKAYEIARSRRSDAQMRQAAREAHPEEHHETSGLRTYSRLVSADTHRLLLQVENAIRHQLGKPFPTDDEVLHMLAADFLAGFVPETTLLGRSPSDRKTALERQLLDDILAGRCRSIESGAWYPLQRDHAIPRSHKIRKRVQNGEGQWVETGLWHPDDPDWPCVYLTPEEHRAKTENEVGTWRMWVERWMREHQWFREKVERFLGDRKLNEI